MGTMKAAMRGNPHAQVNPGAFVLGMVVERLRTAAQFNGGLKVDECFSIIHEIEEAMA